MTRWTLYNVTKSYIKKIRVSDWFTYCTLHGFQFSWMCLPIQPFTWIEYSDINIHTSHIVLLLYGPVTIFGKVGKESHFCCFSCESNRNVNSIPTLPKIWISPSNKICAFSTKMWISLYFYKNVWFVQYCAFWQKLKYFLLWQKL